MAPGISTLTYLLSVHLTNKLTLRRPCEVSNVCGMSSDEIGIIMKQLLSLSDAVITHQNKQTNKFKQ